MGITVEDWEPLQPHQVAGAFLFFGLVVVLHVAGLPDWTGLLDDANLAFHEAGHLVYGIFGDTAGLYGGVLGQLTLPLVVVGVFYWRRQATGVAVGWMWCFENLPNIGRYMADARAQELPLAGGGQHDFTNIFTRWDVLDADVLIGARVTQLGWLGMGAALAWLTWRYHVQLRARG
ncbi:MAG: hypothetical protein R2939_03860 [Kofleriaceae bacterium]